MKNVEKFVTELLAKKTGKENSNILLDSKFGIDLELDSIDSIELILALEGRFNIVISPNEIHLLTTPREMIVYIHATS